ncbi:MAG: DUF4369 domain-containing protein [Muribaculaceae bacterium]|nr:DUF4369 domain-containing protein [Muribaculaceae bacterium]
MKKLIITYAAIMLVALCGCDDFRVPASHGYCVKLQLCDSLRHDGASLYVVNDDYNRLQRGGTMYLAEGRCEFNGQTSGASVAFIKLDSLDRPFYFVLEPGVTTINIDLRKWRMSGGKGNGRYMWLLNERQRLIDERNHNRDNYLKAVADTMLTLRKERQAVVRDSLLADSLQHLLVRYMSGDDAVARIVRERFFNDLSVESRTKLKNSNN